MVTQMQCDAGMEMSGDTCELILDDKQCICQLEGALEVALAESMMLQEVLAPFAFFAEPAAIELAGGDRDKIATVLLKHEHQSLVLSAFLMAREVWDEINARIYRNGD